MFSNNSKSGLIDLTNILPTVDETTKFLLAYDFFIFNYFYFQVFDTN